MELMAAVKSLKFKFGFGTRFRIVIITFSVFIFTMLSTVSLLFAFVPALFFVYNLGTSIGVLTIIIFVAIAGTKYVRFVRNAANTKALGKEMNTTYQQYLNRVLVSLMFLSLFMIFAIIFVILVQFLGDDGRLFVTFHIMLRLVEFGILMSVYSIVWKEKPGVGAERSSVVTNTVSSTSSLRKDAS